MAGRRRIVTWNRKDIPQELHELPAGRYVVEVAEDVIQGEFPRQLIDRLDSWVNELSAPLLPARVLREGDNYLRLEFRRHIPQAVMVGKLVRAVSGIRAALAMAELGYVAECASILRMISDFCTEVSAIAEALNRGGEPPRAVREFVAQYFTPKARTPEEYEASERTRYVSRKELMKAETRMSEGTEVDGEHLGVIHEFLNMAYDAYVHGAYETAMELLNPATHRFEMRGHPDEAKREEFVEAVFLKLHEVVVAIELTAAVSSTASVFHAARDARHTMDASDPWRREGVDGST